MPYPLEPTAEEMRAMGEAALSYLIGFVEGLPDAPAANAEGGAAAAERIRGAPPEHPTGWDQAFAKFADGAANALEFAGPGYLAYIPGGGLFTAGIASFLAAGVNRFTNLASTAPGLVQMEADVVRWFCDLFELPDTSQGILTSGGSIANQSALVTARDARLPEDFLGGTIYVSEQVHASVAKAASLAGFPERSIRRVPVTPGLRMDPEAAKRMIGEDRAAGRTPFFLVASAGTTNTGAVDPLNELATLCADEGLWLHVDAAYGGFFQLTERGRARFRGIERADSITLDPHKGMFLPYGTGCLLVREGALLRDAHYAGAVYLQDVMAGGEVLPSFSEYSPELSREFRGLRVWLPLQLHGVSAFREALDEKLDLAELVHRELSAMPGLEVPWAADLSIVGFRVPGELEKANGRTRALLDRINATKRVHLSSTVVDARLTLRVAVLSHRTHRDRIDELIEIVRAAVAELTSP